MKHSEIRRTFLAYYAERGHTIVPSSSLIPKDDPTLLFTSAGMVQFKALFAGAVPLPYPRATSIQKCLRASDLPEVGISFKHLTFFEMLGNFSFGDYFKKEGIEYAWDYLTNVVKLDKSLLSVSVYEQDLEAWEIWRKHIGLAENRIFKLGAKDNFWGPAGGVGACGPCSEIYFDLGPDRGCGKATCGPGCDCPRFMEVYNVVFPQYDQQPDGARLPLKNRGIDTGLGMERLAMVSQGGRTVFDTDLFTPLLESLTGRRMRRKDAETQNTHSASGAILQAERFCKRSDSALEEKQFLYAAVDHARALTFAIADGAIPSNESRGYMLRSILRRALLKAYRAGIHEPFLYRLSGEVVELMRQWYPELPPKREQAALIIKSEEERFLNTLEDGMQRWQAIAEKYQPVGTIPGQEAFKLHDTFGFHVELTRELAKDQGLELDLAGFEQAMQEQKERSKRSSGLVAKWPSGPVEDRNPTPDHLTTGSLDHYSQQFCGYVQDETETRLMAVRPLEDGGFELELENTPFYAESGGQVGDQGTVTGRDFELAVENTYYSGGIRVCKARVVKGTPRTGEVVKARVNALRRREIERAHTATHLLHAALRCTLGDYVKQEGSLVEPGRLRFDYVAFEPLTPEQIARVARMVYDRVIEDLPVEALRDLPIVEARKLGALAFFGENYGEKVNVIRIGDFSLEFCGGTHLRRTGEIGLMEITSEVGIAAGIRRIEALVGEQAFAAVGAERRVLDELNAALNVEQKLLPQKARDLTSTVKSLESRVTSLSTRLANSLAADLLAQAGNAGDVKVVVGSFDFFEPADLRVLADALRERQKEKLVGLLIASAQPQIRFLVFASDDLKTRFPAGKLAQEVGKVLGGGGGGKPDVAEGGGRKDNVAAGLEAFRKLIAG
jgi:alanyl-tRNA synthetase